jgi:hypothetical protein
VRIAGSSIMMEVCHLGNASGEGQADDKATLHHPKHHGGISSSKL